MGQRSQIYVRINYDKEYAARYGENRTLLAQYYQWNYDEYMVSRAAHIMNWLQHNIRYLDQESVREETKTVMAANYDCGSAVQTVNLVDEYLANNDPTRPYDAKKFYNTVFLSDNNDGRLIIDVDMEEKTIKYAFLDWDNKSVMDAVEYLQWETREEKNEDKPFDDWAKNRIVNCRSFRDISDECEIVEYTHKNIKTIEECGTLMSKEEAQAFLDSRYSDVVAKRLDEIVSPRSSSYARRVYEKAHNLAERNALCASVPLFFSDKDGALANEIRGKAQDFALKEPEFFSEYWLDFHTLSENSDYVSITSKNEYLCPLDDLKKELLSRIDWTSTTKTSPLLEDVLDGVAAAHNSDKIDMYADISSTDARLVLEFQGGGKTFALAPPLTAIETFALNYYTNQFRGNEKERSRERQKEKEGKKKQDIVRNETVEHPADDELLCDEEMER